MGKRDTFPPIPRTERVIDVPHAVRRTTIHPHGAGDAGGAYVGGVALARSLDEMNARNPAKADELAHMLAAIAGECEAADEVPEQIDVTFHDGNGFDVRLSDVREVRRGPRR